MNETPRMQTLAPLWPMLPAFRAVAETEHLPSAAAILDVTPATLSRTVAGLEARLGKPLFHRNGRKLRLNADGAAFLGVVRDAMRQVEDGVTDVAAAGPRGPFVCASGGAGTTAIVAPALMQFRTRHPGLQPAVVTRPDAAVAGDLLRGQLDVAFLELARPATGLVLTRVGTIVRGVYCARSHPLATRARVTTADLQRHEFVAPPPDEHGVAPDGFPAELPRRIGIVVDQLRVGVELCRSEDLLAVLPCVLAAQHGEALVRLPIALVPASPLLALHRRRVGRRPSLAAEFVELVRERSEEPV